MYYCYVQHRVSETFSNKRLFYLWVDGSAISYLSSMPFQPPGISRTSKLMAVAQVKEDRLSMQAQFRRAAHISLAKATLTWANVYLCMCWTGVLCGKGLLQRGVEKQPVIHSPHSSHEYIKQLLSIRFICLFAADPLPHFLSYSSGSSTVLGTF